VRRSLTGVEFKPCWTGLVGALAGALDAAGDATPGLAELSGLTFFAFRLHVHPTLCPSGPTAFPWRDAIADALDQVGRDHEAFIATAKENLWDFKRARAIQAAKQSIDRGVPAIAWHLTIPEFGLVTGYDDEKKAFKVSTCDDPLGRGAVPYASLGARDQAGLLGVIVLKAKVPVDRARSLGHALAFAVDHFRGGSPAIPGYASGRAAYETWAASLREGRADPFGHAFQAQVLAEMRMYAAEFLWRAAGRYDGKARAWLEEASRAYERAHEAVRAVARAAPFPPDPERRPDEDARADAAARLDAAREHEAFATDLVERVLSLDLPPTPPAGDASP
jgi:hypothetical protein